MADNLATRAPDTTPYWTRSTRLRPYPRLIANRHVDVVIVGGGLTGLTTAYLLGRRGKSVAVLERGRIASGETGHTTAHLTIATDTRLTDLEKTLGRPHAQAAWDAGAAAIDLIESIVRDHGIACGFRRVDGYLHARRGTSDIEVPALQAQAALATELGFRASFVDANPLTGTPAVRYADQARFDPRRYLAGLVGAIEAMGGRIYEHSPATGFETDPLRVLVKPHALTCGDVVLATHNPLVGVNSVLGATLFQTKLALYTTYAVAGRMPRGAVSDALFWDTGDPYRYVRVDSRRSHDVVIVGGEDHKTGQADDTLGCFDRLEHVARALAPNLAITSRWSGQVIETPDGLPYIGSSGEHQYTATGFSGNGMTFGTLAGMIISDAIAGHRNPWAELFDAGRTAVGRGLWDYVRENADYPYYLIRSRFGAEHARTLASMKAGEGAVVDKDGKKLAVSRDRDGRLIVRSAICTHMGCVVGWNTAERTWDCPCHGSRFTSTGDVFAGPAESPLSVVD
jgi:glycine/D-amino acid oxidase-like deaminating enzyme/nitrite reductase/ring-hydroxylating ferredoxin subunit